MCMYCVYQFVKNIFARKNENKKKKNVAPDGIVYGHYGLPILMSAAKKLYNRYGTVYRGM